MTPIAYHPDDSLFEVIFEQDTPALRAMVEVEIIEQEALVTAFFTYPAPQVDPQ